MSSSVRESGRPNAEQLAKVAANKEAGLNKSTSSPYGPLKMAIDSENRHNKYVNGKTPKSVMAKAARVGLDVGSRLGTAGRRRKHRKTRKHKKTHRRR